MKKLFFYLFIFGVIILSGCNDKSINSRWKTSDINIDGSDSDWGNNLIYNQDSNFLFGIQNDDKNLYLCFATNDPDLESKIMRLGLIVWFDSKGKDEHNFGIRYPLSFQDINRDSFNMNMQPGDQHEQQPADMNRMNERMFKRQTEVEILGKDQNDITRVGLSELKGIDIKINIKEGRFVYEIKIPLAANSSAPYGLNTDTSQTISVGFETGTVDRSKFKQRSGTEEIEGENPNGEPNAGGHSSGGGTHRRGGGGSGHRGGEGTKTLGSPVNYWTEVKLASGK